MQNDMRDGLVKIMQEWGNNCTDSFPFESVADHLIANGVILPPCKVGDTVYEISTDFTGTKLQVFERKVSKIEIVQSQCILYYRPWKEHKLIGKHYYLTKDQAEQKLKEMRVE